jgi:hypothetical protein
MQEGLVHPGSLLVELKRCADTLEDLAQDIHILNAQEAVEKFSSILMVYDHTFISQIFEELREDDCIVPATTELHGLLKVSGSLGSLISWRSC